MKDIKNGDKLIKSTEKLSLNEDSDKEKNIQKVDDSAESVESENAEDEQMLTKNKRQKVEEEEGMKV